MLIKQEPINKQVFSTEVNLLFSLHLMVLRCCLLHLRQTYLMKSIFKVAILKRKVLQKLEN